MGATKLMTAAGGGITLDAASTATDKTITVPADNGTLVYANSSGNVGIGTSSPSYKMHVYDGTSSSIVASTPASDVQIAASSSGYGLVGTVGSYPLVMRTAGTERARIDTSGKVLVGTSTSPASTNSTMVLADSVAGGAGIQITKTSATTGGGLIGTANGPGLVFYSHTGTVGSESYTERARIDSSGNLLVGTTSVISAGRYSCSFNGQTTNGIVLQTTYASTGTDFIRFVNSSGSAIGNITQNGASTVTYSTSSDYRLKENIAQMTGALAKVAALKPVTYTWKADGSDGQGFIAHELQAVVPDCVTGEKDAVDDEGNPVYQGIDTSFLVATLTAAIQELKAELDAAKADIAALKGTA